MHKQFSRLIGAVSLIAGMAVGPAALAIDRYVFTPLPEAGFGGDVLGAKPEPYLQFVGRVGTSSSTQNAALWRPDGMGGYALTLLPGIGGDSLAHAIESIPVAGEARALVAGGGIGGGPHLKPILWAEGPAGIFMPHVLPALSGSGGVAMSLRRCIYPICGGVWAAGNSQWPDGSSRATLWRQQPSGAFDATDLGTLGGVSSVALTVEFTGGRGVVDGSAQTASGVWHASTWTSDDGGATWAIRDRHPGGASSMFTGASALEDGVLNAGTARTANGRSIGFITSNAGLEDWLQFANARNTSAVGILGNPKYADFTIGFAWNNPANQQAVVWNSITGLGSRAYPVSQITVPLRSGDDAIALHAVGRGAAAGSFIGPNGLRSPVALIADGVQLADRVSVTVGTPEANFSEKDLWHNGDGKTLRIRSRNGNGDAASVELQFFSVRVNSVEFPTVVARTRVRTVGSPDATSRVEMQLFNFTTTMYDVGIVFQTISWQVIAIPAPSADHVNPLTGEVRVRLAFSRQAGNVRGYEIDSLVIEQPGRP